MRLGVSRRQRGAPRLAHSSRAPPRIIAHLSVPIRWIPGTTLFILPCMSADVIHLRTVRGCPVAEKRRGSDEEGDMFQTALVRLVYCMAAWDDDGMACGQASGRLFHLKRRTFLGADLTAGTEAASYAPFRR